MEARAIARHARLRSEKTNVETQREITSAAVRRDGGRQKGLGGAGFARARRMSSGIPLKRNERRAHGDALALGGEEGRDKSRKAAGGANAQPSADVRMGQPVGVYPAFPQSGRRTVGTETSKHRREEKVTTIPPVAASERGGFSNRRCRKACACGYIPTPRRVRVSGTRWNARPEEVKAPHTKTRDKTSSTSE